MQTFQQPGLLSFVHFGDLHFTEAHLANHRDFHALIDEVNTHMREGVDFAVLPGDNADDGTPEQFELVRKAVDRLALPIHVLPGDHDFKTGSLDSFYKLAPDNLPSFRDINGYKCLFLDIVSAGNGGPDFRIGNDQHQWLERQLKDAADRTLRSVVFMHAYPADLTAGAEEIAALFARSNVVLVDMGHTHYNELANDGRTIYAATRSIGQTEEGPAGFSVTTIDRGNVSWRFKPLGGSWPFVMITAPADQRLATDTSCLTEKNKAIEIRALAWSSHGIAKAACSLNEGPWEPMTRTFESPSLWFCSLWPQSDSYSLRVRVEDTLGGTDIDTICVAQTPNRSATSIFKGSDAHSIGAWPERHIFATQLGPNRNGRHW